MTPAQLIITIAVVALGTVLTRTLPFILFPKGKTAPAYIRYLGRVLPMAVVGMLVIYCLKDINIMEGSRGMPEAIAILAVAGLHLWKKQMLLSIAGGTLLYMLLIQTVFK